MVGPRRTGGDPSDFREETHGDRHAQDRELVPMSLAGHHISGITGAVP